MTLPNIMTLGRLVLIPIFILVFYLPYRWSAVCAAIIFLIAALTDVLDGYLARRLQQTSRFGAFLDPVADKLIVGAALVMLVDLHANIWITLPAIVIISREISVSALREWMAEIGQRSKVAVGMLGKIKTVLQMAAVFLLLLEKPHHLAGGGIDGSWLLWLGYASLYAATLLTLWSMWRYLKAAWPELKVNG
jgi:CDP-diacylglycerol--glycerol-3-phosphate 3-phosphatidyltransferase/cardiolipin synthase